MTTIRTGVLPAAVPSTNTAADAARSSAGTPAAADPAGWDAFADSFAANPATQLELLRQRANELGRPELVAPLTGLRLTDDGHHSVASNTLRNYPVKDIYGALFSEAPAAPEGFEAFKTAFHAAPATELEKLRARANELGRPEVMAAFAGLQLQDGGHHSIASNALRNYPFENAWNALNGA